LKEKHAHHISSRNFSLGRGKAMLVEAILPDGGTQVPISYVPPTFSLQLDDDYISS